MARARRGILCSAPGGTISATNGSPHARRFFAAGYLRIVIRRVTAIALPALSLALTRTVTLPERP